MPAYKSIVISGDPGSGKSTLTSALSKDLTLSTGNNWSTISIGGLWRAKHRELYPDNKITFEEFWRRVSPEENIKMNKMANKRLEAGNVIGDFRYVVNLDKSQFLLVFVTADILTRARRLEIKNHIDYQSPTAGEIAEVLRRREEDELRVGKETYRIDYTNPSNYHVVLNSSILALEQETKTIMELMCLERIVAKQPDIIK